MDRSHSHMDRELVTPQVQVRPPNILRSRRRDLEHQARVSSLEKLAAGSLHPLLQDQPTEPAQQPRKGAIWRVGMRGGYRRASVAHGTTYAAGSQGSQQAFALRISCAAPTTTTGASPQVSDAAAGGFARGGGQRAVCLWRPGQFV